MDDNTELEAYVQWWTERSREELRDLIELVGIRACSTEARVLRLRAISEIGGALRRAGRLREGGAAAHRCAEVARDACLRAGLFEHDRTGSTRLARAAGDAGRALVLGHRTAAVADLLAPFTPAMRTVAA